MDKIRILYFKDGILEEREVENDLAPMQKLVGGYLETYPVSGKILLVCDEEGGCKRDAFPNVDIVNNYGSQLFVGPCFMASQGGEDFASLSDKEVELIKSHYHYDKDKKIGFVVLV